MTAHNPQSDPRQLPLDVERLIDQVADEFEQEWNARRAPQIERYLGRVPAVGQAALFEELLLLELELRFTAHYTADIDVYLKRFPAHGDLVHHVHNKFAMRAAEQVSSTQSRGVPKAIPERDGELQGVSIERIGRYIVKTIIGSGGFGIVYLAYDPDLDRQVAIKVPHARPIAADPRQSSVKEARTAAKLQSIHPLIVPVYDHGQLDDGRSYVVMEHIDGLSLATLLKHDRPSLLTSAQIILQLADVLHAAHLQGFVHRDIKPANVLLDRQNRPHLTDFGLAIHERDQHLCAGDASGTLAYRSPEQVRGEANWMDARCDIWALGVILYEMLTGRKPFVGNTRQEIDNEILHRTPKSPRTIDDRVPVVMQAICMRCLRKNVEDRYTAADELAHDLRRVADSLAHAKEEGLEDVQLHASAVEPPTHADTSPVGSTLQQPTVARFFLSYPQGDSKEEALARFLHQQLEAAERQCFIDVGMRAGTDWIQEITNRLQWCDCFVVLISENSMQSEMVQAEVRLASDLRHRTGRPYIVPVRLNYFGPLEYELDLRLGRLQYIRWERGDDSARVLQEILQAADHAVCTQEPSASLMTPELKPDSDGPRPRALVDPRSAVVPGGTIRVSDKYYIRRAQDAVIVDCAVNTGVTLVIKGPRQMGKSSLLMHYLSQCQLVGKRVAFLDLSALSYSDFSEYRTFLRRFGHVLLHRLNLDPSLADVVDSQYAMVQFMERTVLPACSSPLVIAIDEADRVFGHDYQADFFSMLRLWHNNRASFESTLWERLDLVLSISTEPYLLIEEADRSPFNVGLVVEMTPFTYEECLDLNGRYGNLLPDSHVHQLWELLGGHPYLTRLAYFHMVQTPRMSFEELQRRAIEDRGPFGDHLRALHLKLHGKPELLDAMKHVIRYGRLADHCLIYRLYGAGLARPDRDRINPSNLLYARYFRAVL